MMVFFFYAVFVFGAERTRVYSSRTMAVVAAAVALERIDTETNTKPAHRAQRARNLMKQWHTINSDCMTILQQKNFIIYESFDLNFSS